MPRFDWTAYKAKLERSSIDELLEHYAELNYGIGLSDAVNPGSRVNEAREQRANMVKDAIVRKVKNCEVAC